MINWLRKPTTIIVCKCFLYNFQNKRKTNFLPLLIYKRVYNVFWVICGAQAEHEDKNTYINIYIYIYVDIYTLYIYIGEYIL